MKRLEGPPFSRTIAPFFLLGIVEPPDYRRPPELVLELVPSTSPRISPPPRSRSRGPRWGEAPHHPHLPPPQVLFPPSNHSPLSFSLFLHNSSSLSAAQSFHWELGILGESTWNTKIRSKFSKPFLCCPTFPWLSVWVREEKNYNECMFLAFKYDNTIKYDQLKVWLLIKYVMWTYLSWAIGHTKLSCSVLWFKRCPCMALQPIN